MKVHVLFPSHSWLIEICSGFLNLLGFSQALRKAPCLLPYHIFTNPSWAHQAKARAGDIPQQAPTPNTSGTKHDIYEGQKPVLMPGFAAELYLLFYHFSIFCTCERQVAEYQLWVKNPAALHTARSSFKNGWSRTKLSELRQPYTWEVLLGNQNQEQQKKLTD